MKDRLIVSHIYREGNQVADALSKSKFHFSWSSNSIDLIIPLVSKDLFGLPYYRFSFKMSSTFFPFTIYHFGFLCKGFSCYSGSS